MKTPEIIGVGLGGLGLGIAAFYVWQQSQKPKAPTAPTNTASNTTVNTTTTGSTTNFTQPVNGGAPIIKQPITTPAVVTPPTTSLPSTAQASMEALLKAQQEMLAKQAAQDAQARMWREVDKVDAILNSLSNVQNDMKLRLAEVNSIDARPRPADIDTKWKNQHYNDCMGNLGTFGGFSLFGFNGSPCEDKRNLGDGYDQRAQAEWDQTRATLKAPILAALSKLNEQQSSYINNLKDLQNSIKAELNRDPTTYNPIRAGVLAKIDKAVTPVSTTGGAVSTPVISGSSFQTPFTPQVLPVPILEDVRPSGGRGNSRPPQFFA